MAVNISEALLNHAKNRDFHFVGKTAKLVWDIQIDLDLTALREPVHIPADRRCETSRIEQWGMEQMRDGPNLPADLLHHSGILGDGTGSRRIELIGLTLHGCDIHAESGEQLPHTVV